MFTSRISSSLTRTCRTGTIRSYSTSKGGPGSGSGVGVGVGGGGGVKNKIAPVAEQKWSNRTLILLATSVGAIVSMLCM